MTGEADEGGILWENEANAFQESYSQIFPIVIVSFNNNDSLQNFFCTRIYRDYAGFSSI